MYREPAWTIVPVFALASLFHFVHSDAAIQAAPPADLPPIKTIARRLPPKGIKIAADDRAKIEKKLAKLEALLKTSTRPATNTPNSFADIEVYLKAVRFALLHDEFYAKGDADKAMKLLATAEKRMSSLLAAPTLVGPNGRRVHGYYSKLDGSPQPYGIEVPKAVQDELFKSKFRNPARKYPLYVWLHGRGDKTTDMHFIAQRESRGCQISAHVTDGIILHPFGRQCVGYKGPGEVDVFEAIEDVKKRFSIDENRIALMGFSMGGAGAWHIGAHYADQFCIVHAGAGFAETAMYNRLKKENYPPWYEQKLWGMYDVPNYTRNLFNTKVIAYSGENDKQIQAARVMEAAFKEHGRVLTHIIGPKMGHKYHPDSLKQIMKVVQAAVKKGRDPKPAQVYLQTQTTFYNKQHWVELSQQTKKWQDTRIDAQRNDDNSITIKTKNVDWFRLRNPWLKQPADNDQVRITVDGASFTIKGSALRKDKGWESFDKGLELIKSDGKWSMGCEYLTDSTLTAAGPGDIALMAPFIVVEPTGQYAHPKVKRWVEFELTHFKARWRALYRGEVRVKKDVDITEREMNRNNLILWGDPSSNKIIARVMKVGPVHWSKQLVTAARKSYDSKTHIPMYYLKRPTSGPPNPRPQLGQPGYITINTGMTHRESHDRTNSLQNPKLPDWTIVSLEQDPNNLSPGVIKAAGFYDGNGNTKSSYKANE